MDFIFRFLHFSSDRILNKISRHAFVVFNTMVLLFIITLLALSPSNSLQLHTHSTLTSLLPSLSNSHPKSIDSALNPKKSTFSTTHPTLYRERTDGAPTWNESGSPSKTTISHTTRSVSTTRDWELNLPTSVEQNHRSDGTTTDRQKERVWTSSAVWTKPTPSVSTNRTTWRRK